VVVRLRLSVLGLLLVAVATACGGWMQSGFDAGRSRANNAERQLSIANVGTLVHHTMPMLAQIMIGNDVIGTDPASGDITLVDASSCPEPGDGACPKRWSRATKASGNFSSDGVTVFSSGGSDAASVAANFVEATRRDGTPAWSAKFPFLVSTDNPRSTATAVTGGHVLAAIDEQAHGDSAVWRTVEVLPADGCGAATCTPTRSIDTLGTTNLAASGSTLFALASTVENRQLTTRLQAIDLDSGAIQWRSAWSAPDDNQSPAGGVLVVHGARLYFSNSHTTSVYDTTGASCPETPRVCSPTATMSLGPTTFAPVGAVSDRVAMAVGTTIAWFDPGCTGTCTPFATTAAKQVQATVGAIANDIVFTTRGGVLSAYDANAVKGCSGTPRVCTPVWSYTLAGRSDVLSLEVWNGRVYVGTYGPTGFAQDVFILGR
jgi:hypothetical protein